MAYEWVVDPYCPLGTMYFINPDFCDPNTRRRLLDLGKEMKDRWEPEPFNFDVDLADGDKLGVQITSTGKFITTGRRRSATFKITDIA